MELTSSKKFINIAAMKISAVFECNSANNYSADTNSGVQGRLKRNREGKYLVAVENMR